MKIKLVTLMSMAAVFAVQAAVVVDFNPSATDYTAASWNGSSGVYSHALDLVNPIFASGTVAPIYGAYKSGDAVEAGLLEAGIDATSLNLIVNNTGNDASNDGNAAIQRSLLLWKDFSTGDTTFDQTVNSSFTIDMTSVSAGNAYRELRFVIKDSGSYYISDPNYLVGTGSASATYDGTSLTWSSWADPNDDVLNGSSQLSGQSYSSMTFNNVEAVGFYNYVERDKNNKTFMTLTDFQTAMVPEPAAFGLISITGIGLLALRRLFSI